MCSGVSFNSRNLSEGELEKFYTPAQIRAVKKKGTAEQYFWQEHAFLPILTKTGVKLKQWGNKTDDLVLPKTAWAKLESIRAGKWEHLNPKPVLIDITAGIENKFWFALPEGTTGLMVRMDDQDIVYLVTKEADAEYQAKTGHSRQPLGKIVYNKSHSRYWQ